jgi:HEAT repeat protein
MWPIFVLPASFIAWLSGVIYLSIYQHNRQRLRGWEMVAAKSGLKGVERSRPTVWHPWLAGRAGALEVRIENARDRERRARVVVGVPGPPGFSDVRIRRELQNPLPWVREIEIGDPPFDAAFYLGGPPAVICALLDVGTRRLLADVHEASRLEIVNGEIQAVMADVQIDLLLPLLLELGRWFAQSRDVALRLAENAQRDPDAGVRLQNLLLLVREFPGDPRAAETLLSARADPSPQIRLRAAMEMGAEGRDLLEGFAESTEDDSCSAQAVRVVGRELGLDRLRAILSVALRRRRRQTAQACLEALGRVGGAPAVESLAKVLAIERDELAVTAAQALGETGNPAAEPPLIRALERDQADVRVAAATSLALVGSAAAVPPLKDAAERFSQDRDLRRVARQAIAGIQSRLQGASPGQLSLAGEEAGQLSLAQAEAGQLSFAGDLTGQLSLPSGEAGRLSLSGGEEGLKPAPRGAA